VLILLPPSEGKAAPTLGRPLDLAGLSFTELTPVREAVAQALVEVAQGSASRARTTLGLSARQGDELERDAHLWSIPTAPAAQIYTGVLYDALDLASLTGAAKRRAGTDLVISSALFGLLRTRDRIPAYRLSADTTLPRVGRLAAAWRESVSTAISAAAKRGVVLDLRSSAYVGLGPVPAHLSDRTAIARVWQERKGARTIVSHHNKATKGRLVRSLLSEPRPTSISDLAGALGDAGYRVELAPPGNDGQPWTIDVVVTDV